MPRLKVYRTAAGFEDALVAAPSQKAALQAWGVRTDLFASGEAEVVDDSALTAEALARPGEVVRRPRGDVGAFLAAALKPTAGDGANRATAKPKPPDRSRLDAAEGALAQAETDFAARRQALEEERRALDARASALAREAERRLATLAQARDKAQADFEAASSK